MGMKPEGGYQLTTAKNKNFRYSGRVDEKILRQIIALLDLPDGARQMMVDDEIKSISVMAPELGYRKP